MKKRCPVCDSAKTVTHCTSKQRSRPCGWFTCQNCNANFLPGGPHTHHRVPADTCQTCRP